MYRINLTLGNGELEKWPRRISCVTAQGEGCHFRSLSLSSIM